MADCLARWFGVAFHDLERHWLGAVADRSRADKHWRAIGGRARRRRIWPLHTRRRQPAGLSGLCPCGRIAGRSVDEARLALTGQAVPVVEGLVTNLSGGAHFDVSPSGTLTYVAGTLSESVRELKWVEFDGTAQPAAAFTIGGPASRCRRTGRGSSGTTRADRPVMFGSTTSFRKPYRPHSSGWGTSRPSGRMMSNGSSSREGFRLRTCPGVRPMAAIARNASPRVQILSCRATSPPTACGLAFTELDPSSGSDIWLLPLSPPSTNAGGASQSASATPRLFLRTKFSEGGARFSPDGRWLVYPIQRIRPIEVCVRSFPDGERKVQNLDRRRHQPDLGAVGPRTVTPHAGWEDGAAR